jgi:HSP20 family protein
MNSLMTRANLFDDLFRDMMSPGFLIKPLHGDPLPQSIRLDVRESGEAYTVQAEMPGVSRDDIQVTVEGNVVTLKAEVRQQDSQSADEKTLRGERYFGSVARSFQLPAEIDNSQAKARFDNGVLTLTLPKKPGGGSGHRLAIE